MGYRRPTFPYLVVGKKQPKTAHGKIQLDTAQILDISGSMTHNNRINIAKKTLLANSALMRRLNPSNNMYMGVYSDAVKDVTSSDLFRSVAADGYTRTDLALEWLLGKLEKTGEPSIAYLVTDGEPYHPNVSNMMERCINYAERFKKLPIMLTIFLVDGDASSEANIIEIGQAAGSDTKVIPVEVDDLGSGVIRAGADNIHQMYSIGDFARR